MLCMCIMWDDTYFIQMTRTNELIKYNTERFCVLSLQRRNHLKTFEQYSYAKISLKRDLQALCSILWSQTTQSPSYRVCYTPERRCTNTSHYNEQEKLKVWKEKASVSLTANQIQLAGWDFLLQSSAVRLLWNCRRLSVRDRMCVTCFCAAGLCHNQCLWVTL